MLSSDVNPLLALIVWTVVSRLSLPYELTESSDEGKGAMLVQNARRISCNWERRAFKYNNSPAKLHTLPGWTVELSVLCVVLLSQKALYSVHMLELSMEGTFQVREWVRIWYTGSKFGQNWSLFPRINLTHSFEPRLVPPVELKIQYKFWTQSILNMRRKLIPRGRCSKMLSRFSILYQLW